MTAPAPAFKKPTPDELTKLRAAYPQGMPRIDYRVAEIDDESGSDGGDGGNGEVDGAQGRDPNAPIALSISSETPVLRYDWWSSSEDPRYWEVLDHAPKSVIMDYARDGLPFIASHRSYDADQQHGLVENVRVEKKVLRGDARMSRAQRSQEIAQDMRDGIRKKVSVGYVVGDQYTQTKGGADGIPIRRYTAWMPLEVSTVPVPADYDVGVGRAKSADGQAALIRFLDLVTMPDGSTTQMQTPAEGERSAPAVPTSPTEARKAEERTMPDNGTAPGGASNGTNGTTTADQNANVETTSGRSAADAAQAAAQVTAIVDRARADEATRAENINTIASQHGLTERAAEWLRSGKSVNDVLKEVNAVLEKRIKDGPQITSGVEVPANERKRFSFSRALLVACPELEREARSIDLGFEREIMQEARKKSPDARNGGVMVPLSISGDQYFRAGVDSATASTGGIFKFTQPGEFIPLLRNKTSVMRAGATVIPGLTGPVTFPKQLTAATANWVGENPGSDNTASNLTTTSVSLAFKTIQSSTSVSRQALFSAASGNYALDQLIMADLATVIAVAIDLAGLNGLGSSNQPLGLLQDTNVGTAAALGPQGGTMAWGNWIDLESAIGNANADGIGSLSYITNTKQRGVAKKSGVLGNTNSGIPIWQNVPGEMDGIVNGYRAIASNQAPSNLTKGTATGCSAVIFGAFDQILIGMFGAGFETLVDPYSKKNQNMIEITSWNFVDVADRYPTAFATIKDAL